MASSNHMMIGNSAKNGNTSKLQNMGCEKKENSNSKSL